MSAECSIESDGNNICWNAVLTEADLNQLVQTPTFVAATDHSCPQAEASAMVEMGGGDTVSPADGHSSLSTCLLQAAEPHDLNSINCDVISASGMYLPGNEHILATVAHNDQALLDFDNTLANYYGGNVISSSANVITCYNECLPSSMDADLTVDQQMNCSPWNTGWSAMGPGYEYSVDASGQHEVSNEVIIHSFEVPAGDDGVAFLNTEDGSIVTQSVSSSLPASTFLVDESLAMQANTTNAYMADQYLTDPQQMVDPGFVWCDQPPPQPPQHQQQP